MTIAVQIFFLIVGVILLARGAAIFVDKAGDIGRAYKLPQVWIGALIIGIGTSLPEFVISLLAVSQGRSLLAVASIMGSNITNMGLIIGMAGLFGSIRLSKKIALFDIPLSLLPIGILVAGVLFKVVLTWFVGVLLLVVYFMYILLSSSRRVTINKIKNGTVKIKWQEWGLLIIGLVQVVGGGQITLYFVEKLFLESGMSEVLVGSVILAMGTSLPELVTTITAFAKKKANMAVGNILGSNVFNMLGILGTSLFIAPLDAGALLPEAVWLIVISIAFMLVARVGRKYYISKIEGSILLSLYVLYIISMIWLVG